MPTSSHYLCIDNHSIVYFACEKICPRWEDLAARLFVSRSSVGIIRADGKDSADCLRKLLDEWLKRSSPEQPPPTWKGLCDALSHLDRSLSEKISAQHQCGCSLCTECLGSVGVGIVSPLYNEIYQRLQNPQKVADYMYQEDTITLDQLEKIQNSTGNIKEVLFTTLESSVCLNHYHLKVFATALLNEEDTHPVGKVLMSKYKENFSPLAKGKEFIVDVQYKREFQKMRTALGELCDTTISLLHMKEVTVSELKGRLWRSFPELKDDLQKCTSLEEVVDDIIRPRVSLIQIDYLESIFDMFHLATNFVEEYSQAVEDFCERMRVEHAYGQLLMELDRHIPKLESITFVLDWDKNEYCLKDVQDLFKKVVRKYSSRVKVVVMFPGNSVVIECCIPAHLHSLISKIVQDREEILNKEKVISVSAGGCAIFKRTVTVEKVDEEKNEIGVIVDIDSASVHSSDASVLPSSGIDPGDVPLSIDDDVSYSEGILIYERHLRDLRRNEAKLQETVFIKDSMIKKMSAELEFMIKKSTPGVPEVLEQDVTKLENELKAFKRLSQKLYSKLPEGPHPDLDKEFLDAAQSGNVSVVTELLSMGVDVNFKDNDGDTALIRASAEGHYAVVKLLLSAQASVNQTSCEDYTALMEAVKLLLSAGASLDEKDSEGSTALMRASAGGHSYVIQLLVSAGARLDEKSILGYTALMRASAGGHSDVVQLLLSAGASLDEKDDFSGETALMRASVKGHSDVVQLLLSAGARLDEKKKFSGETVLMRASAKGHSDVVKLLLSAGASLNEKSNWGSTALMEALAKGHSDVVQLLLSAGARLEEKDKSQQSAIHLASAKGHVEITKALLSTGRVDLRATDQYGHSPIMIAKVLGLNDLIKLFISTRLVSKSILDKYSLPEGWRAKHYYDGKIYYYKTSDPEQILHEKHPLFEDV